MKDLRYILIDYGRFKDLETILKLKKYGKTAVKQDTILIFLWLYLFCLEWRHISKICY